MPLDHPSDDVGDLGVVDRLLAQPRVVTDPDVAADELAGYFTARFTGALDATSTPVVLLSGGIDSIATAAALRAHLPRQRIVAVTVAANGCSDLPAATRTVGLLDLDHVVAEATIDNVADTCRWAASRLPVRELWEISAAVTLRMAAGAAVAAVNGPAQLWSGDGGDELLGGGRRPDPDIDIDADAATGWLADYQRHTWTHDWTRRRLVPDFYERALGSTPLYRAMTTVEAAHMAARWHATAAWGAPGTVSDKEPLRRLAARLGIAEALARRPKEAMQASSGVLGVIEQAARRHAADLPGATTYTDPTSEPAGHVAARLWLDML